MSAPTAVGISTGAVRAFAILIAAQAAHSVEEYLTHLFAVLPPAAFVSSLFSSDPRTGFAIANSLIVGFGVWCWLYPVRRGWWLALPLAWGWAMLELANGIGHIAFAVAAGGYFPGVATAPLLLLASGGLIVNLRRQEGLIRP